MLRIKAVYSGLPAINNCQSLSIDEVYSYMKYEAELVIEYGGRVFFSEEVAIVEFYWYICRWYWAVSSGRKEDFLYSTVEHTKPILTFTSLDDKTWIIDSIWRKSDPISVEKTNLFEQVSGFIDKVEASFKSDI